MQSLRMHCWKCPIGVDCRTNELSRLANVKPAKILAARRSGDKNRLAVGWKLCKDTLNSVSSRCTKRARTTIVGHLLCGRYDCPGRRQQLMVVVPSLNSPQLDSGRGWSFSGDSAFGPHNPDCCDKVEWAGVGGGVGAMTVRSTHTHITRAFERIPCPIRCTTFLPGLLTLRAHRLNANIDSTITHTYIVAKAKGLNQITLPTWHFENCYETCRITLKFLFTNKYTSHLTYKMLEFTLKCLISAPTCFGLFGPSSGGLHCAWLKLQFCRNNQ